MKSCTIVFSATQPVSRRIRQEFEFTWMTSRSNPSPAVGASTYVFRPSLVFSNATSEHWKLVQSLIKPTDECTVGMGGITSASRTPTIKSSGYHGGGGGICDGDGSAAPREKENCVQTTTNTAANGGVLNWISDLPPSLFFGG